MRLSTATRRTRLLLLLLAMHAAAAADSDPWAAGLDAFGYGDYSNALSYFETARAAGQTGVALHYNIAVCQFELERYDAADANFRFIAEQFEEMRPLALYNRGLVAVEQGRHMDARRFFLAAYQQSDDQTLRILASTMLRRTQEPPAAADRLTGAFGASAGYDGNIVLRDDAGVPADTATDSPFMELYGSLSTPVASLGALHFDASVYLVSYFEDDDFNQGSAAAGLVYQWRGADWRFESGLDAGVSTFGGDRFDDSLSARVRWDYALTRDSILRLEYRYADINEGSTDLTGVAGSQQRAEVRYRTWWGLHNLDLAYLAERNDRNDPGVSASRDRLRLRYRLELSADWGVEAGVEYRRSEYDDLDPVRTEDLTSVTLRVVRNLRSDWQLLARFQFADNDASDELFGYSRNLLAVGILKTF